MEEKNAKKKTFLIIEITFLALFILAFVACIIMQFAASDLAVSKWIEENIWDVKATLISLKTHIPVILNCLIYSLLQLSSIHANHQNQQNLLLYLLTMVLRIL